MFLRRVYDLLLHLSAHESSPPRDRDGLGDCANSVFVSNRWFRTRMRFGDITDLSNSLFDELEEQFERLFSDMSSPAPTPLTDSYQDGLILLLRCCMVTLQFLEFDLSLVVEKCKILLSILRRLCVLNLAFPLCSCQLSPEADKTIKGFTGVVPLQSPYVLTGINGMNEEARRPMLSFFCRVLEVFIDEFLRNCQMRKHFMMTDNVSATAQKLFVSHGSYNDMHAIQEIISSHFLLSANNEWAFNRYINSLFWANEVENDVSELSLSTALTLLGARKMFFIPCVLEAHLVLLASKFIGIQRPKDNRSSNEELMNWHILAFEHSVNVYVDYISRLEFDDSVIGEHAQPCSRAKKLSFESHIQPVTCNTLQHQIDCLVDYCCLNSHGFLSETKADITSKSFAYIKENSHVLDDVCRNEAYLILQYIILNILSEENGGYTKHGNGTKIQQEIYCFAAAVKLMSSSLLQIIWNLRQKGFVGGIKRLGDKFVCREYDFLLGIISYFGKYDSNQFVKRNLLDFIGTNSAKHESILMLAHFASMLCYSYRRRLGFLWNNCIIMMMTSLNLLIFEEGNLDVFMPLVVRLKEMFHQSPRGKTPKVLAHRSSSLVVASNLQRIQMLYLRDGALCLVNDQWNYYTSQVQEGQSTSYPTSVEDAGRHYSCTSEADTCNGEIFVQSLPGYQQNPSEWDDLVDFIECKSGKDYSSWLRNRRRFRAWQHEKRRVMKNLKKEVEPERKLRSKKAK